MKVFLGLLFVLCGLFPAICYSLDAFPPDYSKKRLIITTDIGGGDKDDTQSMIHFLVYSNMFDLEGIVISRPRGDIKEMKEVLKRYEKDYNLLQFTSPDYLTAEQILTITKVGAERNKKAPAWGYDKATAGSRLIVRAGKKKDPRPLYILAWGSVTDIAQAIHDSPEIHSKLIVISGGAVGKGVSGYNEINDPTPWKYMRNIKNKKFLWIDGIDYGGGIFKPGQNGKTKYGNIGFVKKVIKSRGYLGKFFYKISARINVNYYGLKMGDTPTLLFVFNGNPEDLSLPSWGGKACKVEKNHYRDCPEDYSKYGNKSVQKHRISILKDWEQRLKNIYDNK